MRTPFLVFAAAVTLACGAVPRATGAAEPEADVLRMVNGDVLSGRVESLRGDAAVLAHPAAVEPLELRTDGIASVRFAPRGRAPDPTGKTELVLVNGDVLRGGLVELSSERLVLDSAVAGRVSLPRGVLKKIIQSRSDFRACLGFHADDWTPRGPDGAVAMKDDATLILKAKGGATRSFPELPDLLDVTFELATEPDARKFNTEIWFATADGTEALILRVITSSKIGTIEGSAPTPRYGASYARINLAAARARDIKDAWTVEDPKVIANRAAQFTFVPGANVKIRIEFDRRNGSGSVLIEPTASSGNVQHYVSNSRLPKRSSLRWPASLSGPASNIGVFLRSGKTAQISAFRLTERAVDLAAETKTDLPEGSVRACLVDGDRCTGELRGLNGDALELTTPHGRLRVPWERVRILAFGSKEANEAGAKINMGVRGRLSFEAPRLEGGVLSGTCIGDVPLSVPLAAVDSVEMPGDEEEEKKTEKKAEDATGNSLDLANDDKLHGVLIGIDPKTGRLEWTGAHCVGNSTWKLADVAGVRLARGEPRGEDPPVVAALTGCGTVPASDVEVADDSVKLDLTWGEDITVPRRAVDWLRFSPPGRIVYEGPGGDGKAAWETSKKEPEPGKPFGWVIRGDALEFGGKAGAATCKLAELPRSIELSWELRAEHPPLECHLNLNPTDRKKAAKTTFHSAQMQMQSTRVTLYITGNSFRRYLMATLPQTALTRMSAKIRLRWDRLNGDAAMWLDGKPVQLVDRQGMGALPGTIEYTLYDGEYKMMVRSYRNRAPGMSLRNIRIRELVHGIHQAQLRSPPEPSRDWLVLFGGDRLDGTVAAVREEHVEFVAGCGPLRVPVGSVQSLWLGPASVPPDRPGETAVTFAGGQRMVLEDATLADGKIRGRLGDLGQVAVPLATCRTITFDTTPGEDER